MRISSFASGIASSIGLHSLSGSVAEAASPLSFGATIKIPASNNPSILVFTISLMGSVNIYPKAKQLVIDYRTKLIVHLPWSGGFFQFKVHLELLDRSGEVIQVIDFTTSEKPQGDKMTFPVSEEIAKEVVSVRSSFHAI